MYIDHHYEDGLTECTKHNARSQPVRIKNFFGKKLGFSPNGQRTLSALLLRKTFNNDFRRIKAVSHL